MREHPHSPSPSFSRRLPLPPLALALSIPCAPSGRDARRRSGACRGLSQRARLAREKDPRDGRHDRADEGWLLARSLSRGRIGSCLTSPRLASHRLASFAHRRSLHRLAPGIPRGCVTHSTRASIARGCRRWQLSLSLSFSSPPLPPCLFLFLSLSPSLCFRPISALCCPVAIAPIIGPASRFSRCRRGDRSLSHWAGTT